MHFRLTDEQQKLVTDNIGLVRFTISRYLGKAYAADDDIVSTGYIGLCMAAANYDATRGVNFSTFAVKYIRQELYRTARDAHALKRCAQNNAVSLNQTIECEDGCSDELINFVSDKKSNTEETAIGNIMIDTLRKAAPTLIKREEGGYTFTVLGDVLGVSRARAYQKYRRDVEIAKTICEAW